MRTPGLALLLLVAACGDDAATMKRDAALPRDTMEVPTTDGPPLIACTPRNGTNVSVRRIGAVSSAALLATSPPNDGRLFVIEQQGRIRIFENELLRTEPFLDISNLPGFDVGYESGLLGLAFHPNYAVNRQFFVYYTLDNANVVARYFVSETDYNKADPAGEIVMSIPDFASNHNGGMIEFGNDGYLYIGTGDGGHGGDPCRNGQQLLRTGNCVDSPPGTGTAREPLLGKMLRIDVNSTSGIKNYAIPADNPYADGTAGEPEIFISGLRNPWRFGFDRMTGDLFIGDVGQGTWEEITALTPAQQNGANLGWSMYEGNAQFRAPANASGVTMPQLTKNQSAGWRSIIAGQTYHGTCFPDLAGKFFFTDHFSRELHTATFTGGTFTATQLPAPGGNWPASPTSIHADARGELFMTTISGEVFQIEAGP